MQVLRVRQQVRAGLHFVHRLQLQQVRRLSRWHSATKSQEEEGREEEGESMLLHSSFRHVPQARLGGGSC